MERYEWNEDLSVELVVVNIDKFLSHNNSNKHYHRRIFLNPCNPLICDNPRFRQRRNWDCGMRKDKQDKRASVQKS